MDIINEAIKRDLYRIIKLIENGSEVLEDSHNDKYGIRVLIGEKSSIVYDYLDEEKRHHDFKELCNLIKIFNKK